MLQRNMGDSSAGLMQPFCYASGFSYEANKSNPINDALGQSVSFGRFMSESLAWEKWSTFSHNHNRYVEEAERFSRPGSVAEKKAFFEAHYKKLAAQKAAAAANSASSQTQQEHDEAQVDNIINTRNSKITSPKSELLVVNEENEATSSNVFETSLSQSNKVEGGQAEKEHQAFVGNSVLVKMQNHLEDVDKDVHKEPSEKQGSNFDQEVLQSMGKKNAPVFSFKCLKGIGTSMSNRDNIAAPLNNKPSQSSAEKRRSNAKSLHMSLKFALIREINRLTASVMRKFETTRVGAGSIKASNLRTPTKASKNELQKPSSFIPLTEKKRNNMTSPNISSPLSLRTEERAANKKKKLGKNLNASEAQKMQLHIKLKEKAKKKIRRLRQSFCFKARPLPDFNKEREDSKRGTKEVSVVQSKSSLSSPKRLFHGKNGGSFALPLTSNSTMITTHENTSPNIQHGNQNDRNY